MRSLVFREAGRMELVESDIPAPLPGEVVLRVKYCAICGTDVHAYGNGLHIPRDTVMGHEITGTVAAVGDGVHDFTCGDRVIVNPMPRCGECYWCQRGEFSLCATAADLEIGFHAEFPGGLADYLRISYPTAMLIRIPDSLSWEAAALAEPLATSLHAVKQSRLKAGDSAVVAGAGMIGLGVIRFLKLTGAARVVVIEPSASKAALARELGADTVIDPSDGSVATLAAVLAQTDGIGAPVVFECSGVASSFQASASYTRKGGQVILAGFCEDEVPISPLNWIMREIEVKAILGYYDEFADVVRSLDRGDFPHARFITDIVALEAAETAGFRRIMQDRSSIRILVDMERQAAFA